MRTLDIGADKDLPYFSIEEENSALGWRGIRFTLLRFSLRKFAPCSKPVLV
jgi:signal transduction protein with GAF and PtsI domain